MKNCLIFGIRNSANNPPIYVKSYKSKLNPTLTVMEFFLNGTSIDDWEKKTHQIQSIFNRKVTGIQEKDNNKVLLYLRKNNMSELLYWNDKYLSEKSFVLVLGETPLGEQETVNLSEIPHVLIRRTVQAHGKTVLLKLLLMQCIKKQAIVYIADFKGRY